MRKEGSEALHAAMVLHSLTDCHVHLANPVRYTRTGRDSQGRTTSARLDRWLAHSSTLSWITKVDYDENFALSDHIGVKLVLTSPSAPPLGPGSWAFPLHLLNQPDFGGKIGAAIASVTGSNQHLSLIHI